VRPPKSPDYGNLGDASPYDRRVSYESANDARDYDSGPPRGTDTEFQTRPGGPGAYQDSAVPRARPPAPNGPPPWDHQGSSVNESDLDEEYDDHLLGNAAGKGHKSAKIVPSYGLPPPDPNPKQGYRERIVENRQDPYNPYSKLSDPATPDEDERVNVAVSRGRMS
jgi:hypothetical protein